MSKKPFFSIIIPALNEEKYLPSLLEDLATQTFTDFEVLVVDGSSSDRTLAKAKTFSKKLNLKLISSPKRHVCTQRNLGAKQGLSDILIFSDADNRLPPYFLQGLKYRWESSGADLLTLSLDPDIKNTQNETIATAINLYLDLQMSIKPRYLLESMIIISKQAFSSVGGFDETINFAEGKSLIQNIVSNGYTAKFVRDPKYTFSFRRLRKFGLINLVGRVANMELSELLGPEFHSIQAKRLYPMLGGSWFTKPKKAKTKFQKNIAKLLSEIKSSF